MPVPTRSEVEALLAERLAADTGFRDALLADPRGVIEGVIGMPIPDTVHVDLHEESLTHIHLTIPAGDMVSEDDLELVSGGWAPSCSAGGHTPCSYG